MNLCACGCGKECFVKFYKNHFKPTKWYKALEKSERRRLHKDSMKDIYYRTKFELFTKLGGACAKCGINDFRVLDVNHINPKNKNHNISQNYAYFQNLAKKEFDNIELLCRNCHKLVTDEQRQNQEFPAPPGRPKLTANSNQAQL